MPISKESLKIIPPEFRKSSSHINPESRKVKMNSENEMLNKLPHLSSANASDQDLVFDSIVMSYAKTYKIPLEEAKRVIMDRQAESKRMIFCEGLDEDKSKEQIDIQKINDIQELNEHFIRSLPFPVFESEQKKYEKRAIEYETILEWDRETAQAKAYMDLSKDRKKVRKMAFSKLIECCLNEGITPEARILLKDIKDDSIKKFKICCINDPLSTQKYLLSEFTDEELYISGLYNAKEEFLFKEQSILFPYYESKEVVGLRGLLLRKEGIRNFDCPEYIAPHNELKIDMNTNLYNKEVLKSLKENDEILLTFSELDTIAAEQRGLHAICIPESCDLTVHDLSLMKNSTICIIWRSAYEEEKAKAIAREFRLFGLRVVLVKNN